VTAVPTRTLSDEGLQGSAEDGSHTLLTIVSDLTGPILAVTIICAAFGYAFATRSKVAKTTRNQSSINIQRNEETET